MGALVTKYGFFSYENATKKVSTSKVFTASIQGDRILINTKNSRLFLKLSDITTINGSARPATILLCYDEIVDSMGRSDGNAPVNTVLPSISGTVGIGNILTTTNGSWTSDTGITEYQYRWTRNGSVISGATNTTYSIQASDMDAYVLCQVRAKDSDGWSLWANSNSILIPLYWISGGSSVWGTATNNLYI